MGDRVIRWGSARVAFELASSSAEVLEHAEFLARSWPAPRHEPAAATFRIEPDPTGSEWLIRNCSSAVQRRPSAAAAVFAAESLGTQWFIDDAGTTLLHAALLARGDDGIAVIGKQFSGKSTLACALWRHGWALLADDSLHLGAGSAIAHPAPRRVSLRTPSRALLGEEMWGRVLAAASCHKTEEGCVFSPGEIDPACAPRPVQLKALFFLARRGALPRAGEASRIDEASALLALLPYSNVLRGAGTAAALRRLQPLSHVPAFDLGRDEPARMIGAIENALST